MPLLIRSECFSLLLLGLLAFNPVASADDAEDLTVMLHEFLAGVSEAEVHDRFWAEDLVYTSSSGTRTNKTEIMRGFNESDDNDSEEPGPVYSAEEIRIKIYASTAVVAFRLVATNTGAESQSYFNTGTFLKRAGRWQVVAWQATIIPD